MTQVVKIDGAPGTGKTYTLKQKLRQERNDGLDVDGFYWLTFTNAGREDVEPELAELFPDADDSEHRARTFHSLALSLIIRAGVIDPDTVNDVIISPGDADAQDYYRHFCEEHGLGFDPDYSDPRKLLSGDKTTNHTGNLLFAINDWLTQTCKPPEKWRSAPVDIPIDRGRVVDLLEAWDEYKRERFNLRLFEHGNYIEEVFERSLVPDVDVLLVDEFQDLAPAEYRLYKLWRDSGQLDRLYIAGDPNQSIYSFRGGTPIYFEETDTDEGIDLKESRRCPGDIAAVGNAVLKAHAETDPRGFSGRESGGKVDWRDILDAYDLRRAVIEATDTYDADPSVFFLTRTRRQRYQLMEDLKKVGVPFEVLDWNGTQEIGNTNADSRAKDIWQSLRYGLVEYDDVWQGYRRNFKYALEAAQPLLETLEGRTVLTSDHGNLLGERSFPIPVRLYGHPPNCLHSDLITAFRGAS